MSEGTFMEDVLAEGFNALGHALFVKNLLRKDLLYGVWGQHLRRMIVGYWRNTIDEEDWLPWPIPESWVGTFAISISRSTVVEYLRRPEFKQAHYLGSSPCRLCHLPNGNATYSDGTFVWPEGYAHYLEEHKIVPPDHFLQHILKVVSDHER